MGENENLGAPARGRPKSISVIIPIRNCEAHIADQLAALARQTYEAAWELIVVDNGCSDRSIEIVEGMRDQLPSLSVVAEPQRGVNCARNAGARAARGDLLAYCDADDQAVPEWLSGLARAAPRADIVGGLNEYGALNSELQRAWWPSESMTALESDYGFLSYASGANCAVWADVARAIGWDESFRDGASDIEFAWRAQLAGSRLAFAPEAVMRKRYRDTPWATARQCFRRGTAEPHLFWLFREHGMQRSDSHDAFSTWRWLARNAVPAARRPPVRGKWLRLAGKHSGRACGSVRWRVLFL